MIYDIICLIYLSKYLIFGAVFALILSFRLARYLFWGLNQIN